jgi:type IV secretion system protein TrbL
VLAVQLFITIIEFKLTALAGFVLVPFALWNRTSFLAERVLGNVIASGIKVMVLAIIVGIGSGFFVEFTPLPGGQADLGQAMSLVLASLALLGLGIFGPGIASGLVAGAPQLGAGAALGTAAAAAGTVALGGGAAIGGARAVGSGALGAVRAGTAMGAAASTAYQLGKETSLEGGAGAGVAGVASAAAAAARHKLGATAALGAAAERGERAALFAGAATSRPADPQAAEETGAPGWARRLRSEQAARDHRHVALQAIREGDRGGGAANPDISERED